MNRRAARGLATLGVAVGGPLSLLLGAAVAATSPGGSPTALLVAFAASALVLVGSVLAMLGLAAVEASRRPHTAGQGLWFHRDAGDPPAGSEGDHMSNRERR